MLRLNRNRSGQKDSRRDRGFGGKPSALFIFFVRIYVWCWFLRFPCSIDRRSSLRHQGPEILIANHPGTLDAFLLGRAINAYETNYVGSQHFFRFPFLRLLLKWEGAIPKSLSQKDFQALRLMKKSLDAGRVLMIFPQGHRSMDGTGSYFAESFAKFIKRCGVPVQAAHVKGSYLAWPRWADKPAVGPLSVTIQPLLSREEVCQLSVEEIHHRLLAATEFDEFDSAARENRHYQTNKRTDHIERLLHLCPVCRASEAIIGCGDIVTCSRCGSTAAMAANGVLKQTSGTKINWPTVPQWYALQRLCLAEQMTDQQFKVDLGSCTLKNSSHSDKSCTPVAMGTATLTRTGLLFEGNLLHSPSTTVNYSFPLTLFHNTAIHLGYYLQICDESDINWQFSFTKESMVVILAQMTEILLR